MVTVVDALNVFDILGSIETLAEKNITGMVGNTGTEEDRKKEQEAKAKKDKKKETGNKENKEPEPPVDDRSITQLMLDQIEFADVIILSKAPLVKEPGAIAEITALLQRLNPGAQVVTPQDRARYLDVDFHEVPKEFFGKGNLFLFKKKVLFTQRILHLKIVHRSTGVAFCGPLIGYGHQHKIV